MPLASQCWYSLSSFLLFLDHLPILQRDSSSQAQGSLIRILAQSGTQLQSPQNLENGQQNFKEMNYYYVLKLMNFNILVYDCLSFWLSGVTAQCSGLETQ